MGGEAVGVHHQLFSYSAVGRLQVGYGGVIPRCGLLQIRKRHRHLHDVFCCTGVVSPLFLVPCLASASTLGPCPRPWRGVFRDLSNTATCPIRGLQDPAAMTMEQGRGGKKKRTGNGDVKTAGRTAGPSGAGESGAITKIISR